MTWIAAGATVVGAVGSAVVGANASSKASKAQQAAAARGHLPIALLGDHLEAVAQADLGELISDALAATPAAPCL